MNEVRIGIIGMGIGRTNGMALAANPRCRVNALCDLLPERMEQVAAQLPELPELRFTDYKEICASPEVDALFVGTPNQWHVPVALEAVRQGKHVMVTKPLADGVAPAQDLVQAAEAAGIVNMMSLSTRFAPRVQYLGQLSHQGQLGDVYYARARSVRRRGIPDWSLGFIQKGGGAFRDMGVHYLDAAWWIMGMPEPAWVTGVAGAQFGPRGQGYFGFQEQVPQEYWSQFAADDYGGGIIRFANGAGLIIESFWASHQKPELQIELFGTEAGATLEPLTLFQTEGGKERNVAIDLPPDKDQAWQNVADHFVACILDGQACQAPLRHGLEVQIMMEGLLESSAQGHPVDFTQFRDR